MGGDTTGGIVKYQLCSQATLACIVKHSVQLLCYNTLWSLPYFSPLLSPKCNTGIQEGWGEETRSGTEKRCSHNLQSGHPVWWSVDNFSIFPTVNIFRLFRSKKRTGRGNQKCLKNWKKIISCIFVFLAYRICLSVLKLRGKLKRNRVRS